MATRALTAPAARRTRAVDALVVGVGMLVTLALVLPSYARRPFWFDELVSLEIAGLGPRSFVEYVFGVESNMALYHALLGPWTRVSDAEAWVRLPSVAFAVGTLPVLYALGRRLFDRTTAALAVALMCVNVSFLGHARDARSYALVLLLVTASSLFLVRAVQEDRARDWTGWAAVAALAVWAHLFAVLVLGAQVAWLLLRSVPVSRRRALVAVGAVAALVLPLALAVALGGQSAQLDWLDTPGPRQLPGLGEWFVASRVTLVVYAAGVLAALVAAYRTRNRAPYALLLLWLLVPPAIAFVLSYVAEPVYLYRYFLMCLPALVLLAGAGFASIRPLWLGIALATVACGLSVRTAADCQPDCRTRYDDWKAAISYLEADARPGDAIVVYPSEVRTAVDHYLGPRRPRLLYPARWALVDGAAEGSSSLQEAMRSVPAQRRVWLVTWWLPSEAAREALRRRATPIEERDFQGDIHVGLFRSRARS